MPTTFHGLPLHPLLIHVVVILLPLSAAMIIASAVWPAARRRLGIGTPGIAAIVLVFVPITTHAGNWLKSRLPANPAIQKHAHLGNQVIWYAIGMFLVATAVWGLGRVLDARATTPMGALAIWKSPVTIAIAVVAIGLSAASLVQIYRVGDSGAKTIWQGVGQ
ncbi:MAG: DUF2231 domain-containing protein [Mycobacteriales bacterium]